MFFGQANLLVAPSKLYQIVVKITDRRQQTLFFAPSQLVSLSFYGSISLVRACGRVVCCLAHSHDIRYFSQDSTCNVSVALALRMENRKKPKIMISTLSSLPSTRLECHNRVFFVSIHNFQVFSFFFLLIKKILHEMEKAKKKSNQVKVIKVFFPFQQHFDHLVGGNVKKLKMSRTTSHELRNFSFFFGKAKKLRRKVAENPR